MEVLLRCPDLRAGAGPCQLNLHPDTHRLFSPFHLCEWNFQSIPAAVISGLEAGPAMPGHYSRPRGQGAITPVSPDGKCSDLEQLSVPWSAAPHTSHRSPWENLILPPPDSAELPASPTPQNKQPPEPKGTSRFPQAWRTRGCFTAGAGAASFLGLAVNNINLTSQTQQPKHT